MRHKTIFYTLVILISFLSSFTILKGNYSPDGTGTTIILRPRNNGQGNAPRSQPFSAILYDYSVILSAASDLGSVNVTLSSAEGDYCHTIFDTADGAILLPVNGNTGDNYTITIVTNDGIIYEGNFYL